MPGRSGLSRIRWSWGKRTSQCVKRVVFVFNEAERILGIRLAEADEHAYTLSCRSIAQARRMPILGSRNVDDSQPDLRRVF